MNDLKALRGAKLQGSKNIPRKYSCLALQIYGKLALLLHVNRLKVARFKKVKPLKLNIGCGKVKYGGWINIDVDPNADLVIDVRKGLPFEESCVDFIYNEHFLEHLTFEEGERVLQDFYKCLKKGGVVRIATPDLDYVIQKYNTDWKDQNWLCMPEYSFIKTKGRMINTSFREWNHKYLYNEEDLKNHLITAGFEIIERCEWSQSNHSELCGLETRKDSKLIMEATK